MGKKHTNNKKQVRVMVLNREKRVLDEAAVHVCVCVFFKDSLPPFSWIYLFKLSLCFTNF